MSQPLHIHRLAGTFAVCRMAPSAAVPAWALQAEGLVSITRTERELSIIAPEGAVADGVHAVRGYVAYALAGPLELSMIGVLARLTAALAEARVPVLAISTHDTDILLVKMEHRASAEAALSKVATLL